MMLWPFLLIGLLFYLLMIRPERNRRKQFEEMLKTLKKNDKVVTIGGIYGTVVNVDKDSEDVTLRVDEDSNTRLRILRSSVSRILNREDELEGKKKDDAKKESAK